MRGLDTNVLVRYLTQDDPSQSKRANALIEKCVDRGERLYIGAIVMCELVWVLETAYRFEKTSVLLAVERILETTPLIVEDRDLIYDTLEAFRSGSGDFSDYIIGIRNRAAGCQDTVTFDRSLKESEMFSLL